MEEKDLLLRDLLSRLKYGVKVQNNSYKTTSVNTIEGFDGNVFIMKETYDSLNFNTNINTTKNVTGYIHKIKPYLRSMSSMTMDEEKEYFSFYFFEKNCFNNTIGAYKLLDWLNAHHFDYRGLIDKGLALQAPEGMYNINKKL